jgi:hypothetical protein
MLSPYLFQSKTELFINLLAISKAQKIMRVNRNRPGYRKDFAVLDVQRSQIAMIAFSAHIYQDALQRDSERIRLPTSGVSC